MIHMRLYASEFWTTSARIAISKWIISENFSIHLRMPIHM